MSRRGHSLPRALFAVWACVAVADAGAEEKAAPAPRPPPAEDALAIARREFDAVKTARDPALPRDASLPRLLVPRLETPAAAGSSLTKPKEAPPGNQSANWLLEAMEKPGDPRKDRERLRGEREHAGRERADVRANDAFPTSEADRASTVSTESAESPVDRTTVPAVNPLARYLGAWMTPQDYALLKPGLDRELAAASDGTATRSETAAAAAAFMLPLGPGIDAVMRPDSASARAASPVPRENPYLPIVTGVPLLPATAVPPPIATPSLMAPAVVAAPTGNPSPTTAGKTAIPDFVKPATEEKYFKQLKRF